MSEKYGYVRVSSKEQNLERQIKAMRNIGIANSNIFEDKQSGKDFNRPQYKKMCKKLREGDVLFVKSIDRLGRNYEEIIEQWRILTKDKRIDVIILDMPLLDTRKKENGLTGQFISDLVLQILSYVAETERKNIKQRQAEGIAAAKARGVHFGNPGKPLPENFERTVEKWRDKEISLLEALRELDVGRTYFFENIKKLGL